MIEVFTTDVRTKKAAKLILKESAAVFPNWKISFDLADCDKILRIDPGNETVSPEQVKNILTKFGYTAELLTT